MTGDRPIGVEFDDDEPAAGPDEELPGRSPRPNGPRWPDRARTVVRGRYGLPFLVVVAVLAVLVVRALRHHTPSGPAPAPASSTAAAAGVLPRRTGTDPTRCPGLRCYTSADAPAAVAAAVQAVLPGARTTAAETVRLVDPAHGNPLWYRAVTARAGSVTLSLVVQAHSATDAPDGGAKDDGGSSQTYVDAALQQWFVRARTSDRSGAGDRFDALAALVRDPRVLAVS